MTRASLNSVRVTWCNDIVVAQNMWRKQLVSWFFFSPLYTNIINEVCAFWFEMYYYYRDNDRNIYVVIVFKLVSFSGSEHLVTLNSLSFSTAALNTTTRLRVAIWRLGKTGLHDLSFFLLLSEQSVFFPSRRLTKSQGRLPTRGSTAIDSRQAKRGALRVTPSMFSH